MSSDRIQRLSWDETSFGPKLELMFLSRERERLKIESRDPKVQAEGCSALSSTYYSILGTGGAHLKKCLKSGWRAPLRLLSWLYTWLPLMLWCYFRMQRLSDLVVKTIGHDGMTPSQCDIRATILRRSGRYREAEHCLMVGLSNPRTGDPPHVRGLLHIGLANIQTSLGQTSSALRAVMIALGYARGSMVSDPKQSVRIYRQAFEIAERLKFPLGEDIQEEYKCAMALACSADQKLKAGLV